MTARQYIKENVGSRERVIEHLFEIQLFDELNYYLGDDEFGRDTDGYYCEQEDVIEAMLDEELSDEDIRSIEEEL